MLVYGDRPREVDPRDLLRAMSERLGGLDRVFPGIERHAQLVAVLIEAGELAQGLADAECDARGGDAPSALQDAAMALVMRVARAVAASWTSDFAALPPHCGVEVEALGALPLPDRITVKTPEGYAFYAVYPEAYLEAAWELPDHPAVVGLRSIGTSLAAMAAVGAGSPAPITVRPGGDPFDRRLDLAAPIPDAPSYVVVDEGPGLSGSSFGAVLDMLPGRRVTLLPSHDGEPGRYASEAHQRRWRSATRLAKPFEEIVLPHLAQWVADLVGDGELEPLPVGKTRKYRLHASSGEWLLRFAGLGRLGAGKLARAQTMHQAGFVPEPRGLRHGFLVERWRDDAAAPDRKTLLETIARYLAFRAAAFPADEAQGASVTQLADMAALNLRQAGLAANLRTYQGPIRRVRTDNRMHRRKWLQLSDGRILKADALDHDDGHDLIGCQDIAWDVAGAVVELDLSQNETAQLTRAVGAYPRLVAFCRTCYAAFQLGSASLDAEQTEVARYRAASDSAMRKAN